jgi:flagellar basal body-associated protein FliL
MATADETPEPETPEPETPVAAVQADPPRSELPADTSLEDLVPLAPAEVPRPSLKQRSWLIFSGLIHWDAETRKMTVVFWLSLASLIGVGVYSIQYFNRAAQERQAHSATAEGEDSNLNSFLQHQADEARRKEATLILGDFDIELKPGSKQVGIPGAMNMAQVEIVLECDSKETVDYLNDHMEKVRDQISSILVAIDRERLLSRSGKNELKRVIQERLNSWLGSQKIKMVYFSKLLLT